MVTRANKAYGELGGHIASYASAAEIFEVGFNHFFQATRPDHGGDLVYFQPHSAPGIYARAFLEDRLSEENLANFRQELKGNGLCSYPHPWLMPEFWQVPSGSMGIGPINAIYQARFMRYMADRGLADTADRRVWGVLGDGEMDEPESVGALTLAARERLDNLTFVINCNLQRLDGPVRGNGQIIQELESQFAGAGWNVIKVLWGSDWDALFARDTQHALLRRLAATLDGEYQNLGAKDGAYNVEHFFKKDADIQALVAHMTDAEIDALKRGGHDFRKRAAVCNSERLVAYAGRRSRVNGMERQGIRGQLLYRPTDALSARVIGDYETENSECCALVLYNEGPNDGALYKRRLAAAGATQFYDPSFSSVTINDLPHVAVRQGGGSVEGTLSLVGGYTLTSISAYRAWHFVPRYDADNTSVSAIVDAGQSVDDEQWTQEIRLASPAEGLLDWVAGTYYFYQYQDNLLTTQYGSAASALYGLPVFYNDSQSNVHTYPKTLSYAAFAQGVWHATDVLSVTTGVRDTYENKTGHIERDPATGPLVNGALSSYASGPLKVANNDVSGVLNLDYEFDPSVHEYFTVARGAQAGGINEAVPARGLLNSSLYVLPETAIDYELGVKSTLLAQRLMINVTLFWTGVRNYQATQIEQPLPGVLVQTLANIGSIRTRGIETEMSSKLPEWLTFRLTASYNDAIYTSYFDAPCAVESVGGLICNLTGRQVVGAPKWIANPSVNAAHNIAGDLDAYTLTEYAWRSSFFGTPDDSQLARVNAYGLVNLRAGLRGHLGRSAWDFSVWSNNVLDKHYVVGGVSGASGPTFGAYWLVPGTPRFWGGATIRLEF
jgi:outer membrane receptor protein involved in Fe transport/transketolase N-terminal domain/subunit